MLNSDSLEDLLIAQLKELFDSQEQLSASLPDLIGAAHDEGLEHRFTQQLGQTLRQRKRLERSLAGLESSPYGRCSRCMRTLFEEVRSLIASQEASETRDILLIIEAQRIAHQLICGYGSARMLARILRLDEVEQLIDESFGEIKAMDRQLTDLAVDLYTGRALTR